MKIKVTGEGWMMTVSGHRDCRELILKGRDSTEVRALVPKMWWAEAEAGLGRIATQQNAEDHLCKKIGLVKEGIVWKVPAGYIVVHPDGIAEEYMPGFFRRPNGIGVEEGRIFALMEDAEGYGQGREIVGIIPRPKNLPSGRKHWAKGKTWAEITAILHADEVWE